jgi:hypothetical protein
LQFKLFTISATGDSEAEAELNRFLRSHRAVSVEKELVNSGHAAYWCFCIEYLLGSVPEGKRGGRSRVDYKHRGVLSEGGSNRVNRGGTWNNPARNCRSANRNNNEPGNRNNNLGFRVSGA